MSQKELLERIKSLDLSVVDDMSSDVLARLTDNFKESLVKSLMVRRKTNPGQRKLIKKIKEGYKSWKKDTDLMWGAMPQMETYPEYMEKMQFDIECGYIITAEGLVSEPKLSIDVPSTFSVLQAITSIGKESKTDNKGSKETQKRIRELEAQVEQLSKNTSVTQEEFNAIFNNESKQDLSDIQTEAPVDVKGAELEKTKKKLEEAQQRIKELEAQVEELQKKLLEDNNEPMWIDWLDNDVFASNINAEEIYKVLCKMPTPHLIDRPRCYVLYRVLSEIGALKGNAAQKDILKWWNAHFECGWHDDNQFKFTELPESIKSERDISHWNRCKGRNAEHYHAFAQDLIKELAWNMGRGEYEIKKIFQK